MCSDYLPRPTRRIERTTRPLDVALPSYAAIAAVITATNSASSERSGPVTAGAAATGLTAGAAAFGVGAGAAAFFLLSSHAWMYLKHEIRILMKIKTRNTVPIPIMVYQ